MAVPVLAPARPPEPRPQAEAARDDGGLLAELRELAAAERGWQEQALCAQADPDAWFPEKGGSAKAAKRICAACPVTESCLEYALKAGAKFGIFGGKSERERRRIRRERQREAA